MSELEFETMLKHYFGEKASHCSHAAYDKKERSRWFKKLESKLARDIESIDTSERHKSMMLKNLTKLFSSMKNENASWISIFRALQLIARILGYDYVKGSKLHNLNYYQDSSQYYTQLALSGEDIMQDHYDEKDIISERAIVAKSLKEDGKSTFRISQILNISENKVKELVRDF
ncbi:MAG: hypothetical protein JKX76_04335 [Colwellia sp.]|nr:hypothetical protein [Colwellia sp.]